MRFAVLASGGSVQSYMLSKIFSWGGHSGLRLSKIALQHKSIPSNPDHNNPRVLVASVAGGINALMRTEAFLGLSLTERDAEIDYLLCDKILPACIRPNYNNLGIGRLINTREFRESMCDGCIANGNNVLSSCNLDCHYFSEFITEEEKEAIHARVTHMSCEEILGLEEEGVRIGEHARAGSLRFMAKGLLDESDEDQIVLRYYAIAALMSNKVFRRALTKLKPTVVLANHGIYVPHGILVDVCKVLGIRVVTWNVGYREKTFIFAHGDTYHHQMLAEDCNYWSHLELTEGIRKWTMQYLDSRKTGKNDWVWFHNRPNENILESEELKRLSPEKPIITLLTNVFWDAQLHFKANIYSDMLEWIVDTVLFFKSRQDLSLVIRVHPAEIRGTVPSRQLISDELFRLLGELPGNVSIVGPESEMSTYALCDISDTVLIYGTKTGAEIAALGTNVIVAGEAWIRDKGFCDSPTSKEEYRRLLGMLPKNKRLDKFKQDLAIQYAYHFFRRRFIAISAAEKSTKFPPFDFRVNNISDLRSGVDPGLDSICNGILYGDEFIDYDQSDSDRPMNTTTNTSTDGSPLIPWSERYSKVRNSMISHAVRNISESWITSAHSRRPSGYGLCMDERVVEIPWVVSRVWGSNLIPASLLDVGCAFYKFGITRELYKPERLLQLIALDKRDMSFDVNGPLTLKSMIDIREVQLPLTKYDVVICISTLEHIGMDNTDHYTSELAYNEESSEDYRVAVHNMLKLTNPGGKLLITVPFGTRANHKWLQVFDRDMIGEIQKACIGHTFSVSYFRHAYNHGWIHSNAFDSEGSIYNDIHNDRYYDDSKRVAAAESVACIEVVKSK